jgi:ribonuclease HI
MTPSNRKNEVQITKLHVPDGIPTIIATDANAWHTSWGCRYDKYRGKLLLQEVTDNYLTILNTGEPTTTSGSAIDLTIVSNSLATKCSWKVLPDTISDCHHAIHTTITHAKYLEKEDFVPKYKLQEANWPRFTKLLEERATKLNTDDLNLDEMADKVTQLIQQVASETIPRTKYHNNPFRSWYWNEKCAATKNQLNRWLKYHRKKKYPAEITKPMIAYSRTKYIEALDEARKKAWDQICGSISLSTNDSASWRRLKFIMKGGITFKPNRHPDPQGEANKLAAEFAARTKTDNLPPGVIAYINHMRETLRLYARLAISKKDKATDQPFTMTELNKVLKINKRSTPGEDQISYSMLKNTETQARHLILKLANKTLSDRRLPNQWKTASQIPIPKPGNPNAKRPISLLVSLGKTIERMVLDRIIFKVTPRLHPNLLGFIKGKGTTDGLCTLALHASRAVRSNYSACLVAYIDLEKAFELANPLIITTELARLGVTGNLLAWVADYLTDRRGYVTFQGHKSDTHVFQNGTPQGAVISPFLFNILINRLLQFVFPPEVMVISYADDIVVICNPNKDNQAARMQHTLNILANACTQIGLKINANKTKAMMFRKGTHHSRPDLTLQGHPLEFVSEYKYLGVFFTPNLKFQRHVQYITPRIIKKINLMKCIAGISWGTSTDTLLRFHKAAIRPMLEYGIQVLAIADMHSIKKLELLERRSLKLALGLKSYSDNVAIYVEAGLQPLTYRIQRAAMIYYSKISSLGAAHPLANDIPAHYSTYPKRRSHWNHIIDRLMNEHAISPPIRQSTMLFPPWDNPAGLVRFIKLPLTKPKSKMTQAELENAGISFSTSVLNPLLKAFDLAMNIFTDGSVNYEQSKAGIGIILLNPTRWWANIKHQPRAPSRSALESLIIKAPVIERHSLRVTDGVGSLLTELEAIRSALEIVKDKYTSDERVIFIHTDSLSSHAALQNLPPTDNIRLIKHIYNLIRDLARVRKHVVISWIPSHSGILYNDLADHAANEALQRPTIDREIYHSLSSVRSQVTKAMITKFHAKTLDCTTSTMAFYRKINTRLKPQEYKNIDRRIAASITRLRFNIYKRCPWRDPQYCTYCEDDHQYSTVHYLIECPVSSPIAYNLKNKLTDDELNASSEVQATAILNYSLNYPQLLANMVRIKPPAAKCKNSHS